LTISPENKFDVDIELAYGRWQVAGKSLVESANFYNVTPDELIELHRQRHPVRARIADVKIALAIQHARVLYRTDRMVSKARRWMGRGSSANR
jgi:hypothetical protein